MGGPLARNAHKKKKKTLAGLTPEALAGWYDRAVQYDQAEDYKKVKLGIEVSGLGDGEIEIGVESVVVGLYVTLRSRCRQCVACGTRAICHVSRVMCVGCGIHMCVCG